MSAEQKIKDAILRAAKVEKTLKQRHLGCPYSDAGTSSAEEEEEAFGENTDQMHEAMQKLRMDSMQAEIDKLNAEIENTNTKSKGHEIDNSLRKHMAWMTFGFMVFWCVFVAVVFSVYLRANDRNPPPEVIIALLGTSTITIVGLVGFVVSGLFKSTKKEE